MLRFLARRSFSSALPTRTIGFELSEEQQVRHNFFFFFFVFSLFSLIHDGSVQALQDLARKATADYIIPAAAHHDKTGEYPWPVLKELHRLGLLNLHVPQKARRESAVWKAVVLLMWIFFFFFPLRLEVLG
jgi:hypothetical protein